MKKISWLKSKKNILTISVFIILFILSIDLWAWDKNNPHFLGFPIWMIYLIILTISLSVFFLILAKNIWSENK